MTAESELVDAVTRSRFEWTIDTQVAVVTYRREGQTLWLDHAGVPAALGGRGMGSQLVEAVLQTVRRRGERVRAGLLVHRHLHRAAPRTRRPRRLRLTRQR